MAVRAVRPLATRDAFRDEQLARMNHVHDLHLEPVACGVPAVPRTQYIKPLPRVKRHCMTFNTRVSCLNMREREKYFGNAEWKDTLRRSPGDFLYSSGLCCRAARRRLRAAAAAEVEAHLTAGRPTALGAVYANRRACRSLYRNSSVGLQLPSLSEEDRCQSVECALEVLRNLFLPICRLWLHRRRCPKATLTPAEFKEKLAPPSIRQKVMAVGVVLSSLRCPQTRSFQGFRQMRSRAVIVQRAYRRHKTYVEAHVELNYRKIRHSVEKAYLRDVEEENRRHDGDRPGLVVKRRLELNVDVPTWGERLPELFIRHELRSLYYCWMARCLEGTSHERLPTLLPRNRLYSVLDNVCYITSEMRGDPQFRVHLERRPRMVVPYYGRFVPSTGLKVE